MHVLVAICYFIKELSIQLYSEVLRKLGIYKNQLEMFEDYQSICDATPKSSVIDELSEERSYRRGR